MENKYKKVLMQLLDVGYEEVEELIKIEEYCPEIINLSKEIAEDCCQVVNFSHIISAVTKWTKDRIDYHQINIEISDKIYGLSSGEIIDICKDLENFIDSVIIDDNGCCWGLVGYSESNYKFREIDEIFASLVKNEISLDEFYIEVSNEICNEIGAKMREEEIENRKPLAVYTVSNNMALYIYEIEDDYILVGPNKEDVEECSVEDDTFIYGELELSVSDFIRI